MGVPSGSSGEEGHGRVGESLRAGSAQLPEGRTRTCHSWAHPVLRVPGARPEARPTPGAPGLVCQVTVRPVLGAASTRRGRCRRGGVGQCSVTDSERPRLALSDPAHSAQKVPERCSPSRVGGTGLAQRSRQPGDGLGPMAASSPARPPSAGPGRLEAGGQFTELSQSIPGDTEGSLRRLRNPRELGLLPPPRCVAARHHASTRTAHVQRPGLGVQSGQGLQSGSIAGLPRSLQSCDHHHPLHRDRVPRVPAVT